MIDMPPTLGSIACSRHVLNLPLVHPRERFSGALISNRRFVKQPYLQSNSFAFRFRHSTQ